jgi:hypothetical protein
MSTLSACHLPPAQESDFQRFWICTSAGEFLPKSLCFGEKLLLDCDSSLLGSPLLYFKMLLFALLEQNFDVIF